MYTDFFNLTRRPFAAAPAVENCVFLPSWNEMLNKCHADIDEANGPILVIGPSGCGKSMFLEVLARKHCARLSIVHLGCASISSRHELIQCILFELGLDPQSSDEGTCRLSLIDHLKSSETCPHGLLLLVDEANALSQDVLTELKMITNLVCGGSQHVRLVLAGNRSLEEHLSHPQMESFNQRIGLRCYLNPLSRDETFAYVLGNMQNCGGNGHEIFKPSAIEKIHDLTDGIPRVISQLCHNTLKMAFQNGESTVNTQLVQRAWHDLQQLPMPSEMEPSRELSGESGVLEFGTLDGEMLADLPDTAITDKGHADTADESDRESAEPSQFFGYDESSEVKLDALLDELQEVEEPPQPVAPDASELFGDNFDDEEPIVEAVTELTTHTNYASLTLTTMDVEASPETDPSADECTESETETVSTFHVGAETEAAVAIRFPDGQQDEAAENRPDYIDDQDILNVQPSATPTETASETDTVNDSQTSDKDRTGQAVRMDYLDLFQQLKSIQPKSS